MKAYYALLARGSSYRFANGSGRGFAGQNDFVQVEANNLVEAFLKIYQQLSEEKVEISALKVQGQDFVLGFSAGEWEELSNYDIRIKESTVPENGGIQIQAIRDVPFC